MPCNGFAPAGSSGVRPGSGSAATPVGFAALAGATIGFLAFALVRLAASLGDHAASRARRLTRAGQALSYLGLAMMTGAFLLGRRSTGSEQQQDSTVVHVAQLPMGRPLLAGCGLVMICVCGWQLWNGVRGAFADSLDTDDMPPAVRGMARSPERSG